MLKGMNRQMTDRKTAIALKVQIEDINSMHDNTVRQLFTKGRKMRV